MVVPEMTVNGMIFLLPAACSVLSQKEGTVCISFGFLMALPAHINHAGSLSTLIDNLLSNEFFLNLKT